MDKVISHLDFNSKHDDKFILALKVIPLVTITYAVVDLHSKILDAPSGPHSFIFMHGLGNFGKIVWWRPLEDWSPHLGEILDPRVLCILIRNCTKNANIANFACKEKTRLNTRWTGRSPLYTCTRVVDTSKHGIFFLIFGGHKSLLWGYWYPCFQLLVMSPLGFKASGGIRVTCSLRFISGATPADPLAASMTATYLWSIGGTRNRELSCHRSRCEIRQTLYRLSYPGSARKHGIYQHLNVVGMLVIQSETSEKSLLPFATVVFTSGCHLGCVCGRGGMYGGGSMCGSRDSHCSRWYTSYWSAFLLTRKHSSRTHTVRCSGHRGVSARGVGVWPGGWCLPREWVSA